MQRRTAAFLSMVLATAAAVSTRAALDDIVPLPKQVVDLHRSAPLSGRRLLIADDPKCRIGAEEINERIRELGGRPLPVEVLRSSQIPPGSIVLAPCTAPGVAEFARAARVTPSDPGPQGYAIRVERSGAADTAPPRILLIGSDAQGALYAAVTMRRLIVRAARPDSGLELQLADIRDWPDYLYRCCGTPFSEHLRGEWYAILARQRKGDLEGARELAKVWVARQKRYVEWMLRAKINMAWFSTSIRPADAPDGLPVTRSMLREVNAYALARGIRSIAGDTTAIGVYPRDKDNPEFRDVVFNRAHKRYFCWSRLDLHRARARRAAKWLKDCGYTGYYLHACDSGGWRDPALWSRRCERCRKTYGDDHARADAAVFNTYYREIKKAVPGLFFNAVVYPYNARYLDPDYIAKSAAPEVGDAAAARALGLRTAQSLRSFLTRLNTLLAPDIRVCIRECERRYMQLARAAWAKRDFYTYFEYAWWKGWRPYFVTTPLFTVSLFDPAHRDDVLFGNVSGTGWTELTQLLGVECAWNVHRPGAREFNGEVWRNIGTRVPPFPERRTFALRACRFWFGEEAGPLIAPAFAENISWTFIAFPDDVQKYLDLPDPAATMRAQVEATARAADALDRLWALQKKRAVLDGDRLGYFLNLYRITRGAHLVAAYRAEMLAARQAVERQDAEEARRRFSHARQIVEEARPKWKAFVRELPLDRFLASYLRRTAPPGCLMDPDLDALGKEADAKAARVDRLVAAYVVPDWFQRTCRRRELAAVRTPQPPVIDGVLDDVAWTRTPPIEHFMDHRVLRLESLETTARLAWDARALYVAFDCKDPDPSSITTRLPERDQHALCDSAEVLVSPRSGSREFVHWIVDSFGTVFDAAQRPAADGGVRYSRDWNGHATIAVRKKSDRWCVEMAIPVEDLGLRLKTDREARILLCRNIVHTCPKGEHESVAVVFLDGAGFHAVERFTRVRFVEAAAPEGSRPQVALVLRPVRFREETTGSGTGVRFGGGVTVETNANLHDVRVDVEYTDGVTPLGRRTLGEADLVQLAWRPKSPFSVLIERPVSGVECRFHVAAREGRWSFVRRFGRPRFPHVPQERLFAPGVSGKALAFPVFFVPAESARVRREEGTVEFWIRPHWDGARKRPPNPGGELEHTLLNVGPIRPDYPGLSNCKCLTIYHNCHGYLRVIMANDAYEPRTVQAPIRDWRAGEWHHVAVTWRLDDGGKTAMTLFLDGRPASSDCRGSSRRPNDRPLRLGNNVLPMQIGSMTTGFRPADADIDELRVSRTRRYRGAFTPVRRPAADTDTVLLFRFDGTLSAETPAGLRARPGPAQQASAPENPE